MKGKVEGGFLFQSHGRFCEIQALMELYNSVIVVE
jgi:hypothetical protein